MRKLFGTDGIRGVAGNYPLDAATTFAVGQALGHYFKHHGGTARFIIGQDTRESAPRIGDNVASGIVAAGGEVVSAGVITTPGVAYLARTRGFQAGIVISASHNPWHDNGIKVFGGDGYKLADAIELEIENEILRHAEASVTDWQSSFFTLPGHTKLRGEYVEWLLSLVDTSSFKNISAVVDCANGAASPVARDLFARAGMKVKITHADPNGKNINEHCGALHPAIVAAEVASARADMGITFDGDADRALFADERGSVVDGDAIMLLLARDMHRHRALKSDTVVATTMSNMGLEAAFRRSGIRMLRAPVGDKYVLEEMKKSGAALGGEQSGHIILSDVATTGDGLLTALKVLEVVGKSGKKISELVADLEVYPQIIKNVRVREKKPLEQFDKVQHAIRSAEAELNGTGRVVIRYSGTEALARVMIEAESRERMQHHAEQIAAAIEHELGA
ncbi:MAG: phosphoglucosamine mutase [Acidobacteriales bacterium]|nr:phosphoglucosamine mutase [Terriglobales bacterium]